MASSPAELVKEKLDVVDFLRGYLELTPAGKNFKALCPFHKEKTPSFMISPDRQSWRCFGCSAGGDVFSFLMQYENLEFYEALKILAEKTGVELRRASPAEYKQTGLLYELNERAKEYFVRELAKSEEAQNYLASRGLRSETIEGFELGYAPEGYEALSLHLLAEKYAPEDTVRAGLAFKTERGLQIDRFRGRIMFPIHNHFGKVIGFTGRVLPRLDDGKSGKYVNSPETPIFMKSKVLYGLWKTKSGIKEKGSVFLVEGQMDMLMSHQAGVSNVVAASGTALTTDHLRTLGRVAEEIIMSFDNDEAGFAAGERAIALAEANDFSVKVLLVPKEGEMGDMKDPADVAHKDPDLLKKLIKEAKPAPEFYFERYLGNAVEANRRSPEFKKNIRIILGKLKAMASAIDRSFWMKELSKRTGIDEKVLIEEAERHNPGSGESERRGKEEEPRTRVPLSRWELLSQHLLAAGVARGAMDVVQDHAHYLYKGYMELYELLKQGVRASDDGRKDEMLEEIILQSGALAEENMDDIKEYLAEEYRKEKRRELTGALKEAEEKGDEARAQSVLRELAAYF